MGFFAPRVEISNPIFDFGNLQEGKSGLPGFVPGFVPRFLKIKGGPDEPPGAVHVRVTRPIGAFVTDMGSAAAAAPPIRLHIPDAW